jgi:hypothetical protein
VKLLVETNKNKKESHENEKVSRTVSVAVASLSLAGLRACFESSRSPADYSDAETGQHGLLSI